MICVKKKDHDVSQLQKELYNLLFECSCLKRENESLKEELKNKGSYKSFQEKFRPQTANIKLDQTFNFNSRIEDVEIDNTDEVIDEELDDLLRKSTNNLNSLKEEIHYLQTQTTANSNSFKKVKTNNELHSNQSLKSELNSNYEKKEEILIKPRQRSLSKINYTKEMINIINKK